MVSKPQILMDHWCCCEVRGIKRLPMPMLKKLNGQGEIKDHAPVEGLHEEATKAPNDQGRGR